MMTRRPRLRDLAFLAACAPLFPAVGALLGALAFVGGAVDYAWGLRRPREPLGHYGD